MRYHKKLRCARSKLKSEDQSFCGLPADEFPQEPSAAVEQSGAPLSPASSLKEPQAMSENVADPDTRIEVHIIGQEASAPKKRGWWGHRRPNDMNSMIDY